jgi:hypothetical protein
MSCGCELHIADDYGDNHATMRCQLDSGHDGKHREVYRGGKVQIEWEGDDRPGPTKCIVCDVEFDVNDSVGDYYGCCSKVCYDKDMADLAANQGAYAPKAHQ